MTLFQIVDLDIAAIFLLSVIYIYISLQYSDDIYKNVAFKKFLRMLLLHTSLDIISEVARFYATLLPHWVVFGTSTAYFIVAFAVLPYFTNYMECILFPERKITKGYILQTMVPTAFCTLLLLINMFVPILFSMDEYGAYSVTPLYCLEFIVPVYYYVRVYVLLCLNRKKFSLRQRVSLTLYSAISIINIAMEVFIGTQKMLFCFGASVAAVVMLISLETPDYQKLEKIMKELEEARKESDVSIRVKKMAVTNLTVDITNSVNDIINVNKSISGASVYPVSEVTESVDRKSEVMLTTIKSLSADK